MSLTCLFYTNTNKQYEQGKRLGQGRAEEVVLDFNGTNPSHRKMVWIFYFTLYKILNTIKSLMYNPSPQQYPGHTPGLEKVSEGLGFRKMVKRFSVDPHAC